ncbi:MAG: protein kinase [Chitinivibrionales bacterium]|nr:protein kinase [Chitinivibrionales bacterium]
MPKPQDNRNPPTNGEPASPPGARSDMPCVLGKYHITRWLGAGAMSEVWLAEDDYGNEVAIKLFSAVGPSQEHFLRMFLREAHTLSMLQHRNICRVYGVEEYQGRPYIVMEYVQGVDLASLLKYLTETTAFAAEHESGKLDEADLRSVVHEVEERLRHGDAAAQAGHPPQAVTDRKGRALPLQQALSIVIKLCDAIQYAHERGVFHRDIKPSNIVVRPDGEPVLLDFGVAKLTGERRNEALTRTGELPGTLEYAAPEQHLSGKHVDERADVYSIGAVLYEMVTGHRYFVSSGAFGEDVERLKNYLPVRPRARSYHIDRELEAIILKAVAVDPEQRYRAARSLAQDLVRYQEGQPVVAKPPTFLYLLSKFVRRNALGVTLSSVIAVLTFLLAGYYALDYYRHWGAWIPAFEHDFISRPHLSGQFEFVDTSGAGGRPWVVDSVGLHLGRHDWCWVKGVRVSGNCRVVMRLHFDDMPDGFEIAINSAPDPVDNWYFVPRGYSCQVGGYLGTLDFISINNTPGTARATNPVPSRFDHTKDIVVVFQREGERISLFVNGRKQAEERDILPFWGPDFSRIGFRTYATSVHVRSIEVYRMSLPKKASPLIAGDVLASLGYARDAIRTYLGIANDYRQTQLAEKSLVRSMHAVYQLPEPYKSHLSDSILGVHGADIRPTASWQDVREMQLLDTWKNGRYEQVLRELPAHFKAYPATRIALELQNAGGRSPAPDTVRAELFAWATRTRDITCLNARNMPQSALELVKGIETLGYLNWNAGRLSDLSALSGMRLVWLELGNNQVADLSPLWGQPLSYFSCTANRISDLRPLANAPLRIFVGGRNRIRSIAPLRFWPLEYASFDQNRIRDISVLHGKEIRYLFADGNRLTELQPLEGMPLRILSCSSNRIASLAPLRRAPLRELQCGWNQLRDLVPLTGKPLELLSVEGNAIESIDPLAGLPLRTLRCATNRIDDLSPLRHTRLRTLDCHDNHIADLSPLGGLRLEVLDCRNNRIEEFGPILNMRLRVLRCGGNRTMPLAAIAKIPLRELSCSSSDIVDLWPLAGARLQTLDCSHNDISDLSPLASVKLSSLNCRDNRIRSLNPVRLENLTRLDCARNSIRTLDPLRAASLQYLDCRDNPIRSLEPIADNPPAELLFCTATLPVAECERVAAIWERDTAHTGLATQARILACINGQQWHRMRDHAVHVGDRDYLWIPWELPLARARAVADSAGGHLLRVETDTEWLLLHDSLGNAFSQTCWAGVVEQDGELRWDGALNDAQAPDGIEYHADGHWVFHTGELRKLRASRRLPFAIEWPPRPTVDKPPVAAAPAAAK